LFRNSEDNYIAINSLIEMLLNKGKPI